MSPAVSIVIPMYNARAWIEDTLHSVLRQTYPREDVELIVVDDASQDDSVAVADAFLREHLHNGRIIKVAPNAGVSAARNTGWLQATGAWLQFVDADDLLAPHKLQLQATQALTLPDDVAVVYSNWQHIGPTDGGWQPTGAVIELDVDADTVSRILQDVWFGYVGPTLIRRSSLVAVGGLDKRLNIGEDVDLMLRIAMAGGRFHKVPSPGPAFFYRQTPNSLWRHSAANVESMRNLAGVFRRADVFLRQHSATGRPPADAAAALAQRYARCLDFLVDHDSAGFAEILAWTTELGLPYPPDSRPTMRLMSRLVGYGNALRLRAVLRRRAGLFRSPTA